MKLAAKDTAFYTKHMLNCRGKPLELSTPAVMGVLNITPDSFFAGSRVKGEKHILELTTQMIAEGATIIDVGGYSSRPGAEHIDVMTELQRVIPAIEIIVHAFPNVIVSIDTFRAQVAEKAVQSGASIVNDISGGELDEGMFEMVSRLQVPYVLMHMQGNPKNMQSDPQYENVVGQVLQYFNEKVKELRKLGIVDIILDPGFGFGKTLKHNYALLAKLDTFKSLNLPIMVGLSRKSMINKIIKSTPDKALNGTSVLNTLALVKGASILRVHDVKEALETILLTEQFRKADN